LIMKYLKMSDADLELNEKYKFEEQIEAGNAENDESMENSDEEMTGDDLMGNDDSTEGGGEDFGSGAQESDEAGGLDSEILNSDVQPE